MSDNRTVPIPAICHIVFGVFTAEPLDRVDDWEFPPPELLRRFGASTDDLAELGQRPHLRLVGGSTSAADAASTAVAVRSRALDLADEHGGMVVDLGIPRLLDASEPDAAVSSQWVAFGLTPTGAIESAGLSAFGLPEITWPGPVTSAPATLAVLTGLAHRLIAEWPANDPVGPATVTLADIARGLDGPSVPRDQGIDVTIDYDGEHLVVSSGADPTSLFD